MDWVFRGTGGALPTANGVAKRLAPLQARSEGGRS